VIRFSAVLVVVGLGLLLAGAFTSELVLVYAAIAVCVVATALLAAGVIIGRDEILGHDVKTAGVTRETDRAAASAFSVPAQASGSMADSPVVRGPVVRGPVVREAVVGGAQDAMAGAPSQTAGAGQPHSGLGWPAGKSPTEALWDRVDAELSIAGATTTGGTATGAPVDDGPEQR